MRTVLLLLHKEFRQVFRNKAILPIIFVVPIVQLLVLVHAADFEVHNIRLLVIDMDHSVRSRSLIARFTASDRFQVMPVRSGFPAAMAAIDAGDADALLRIPNGFEHDLARGRPAPVMLDLNGVDGQFASLVLVYSRSVVASEQARLVERMHAPGTATGPPVNVVPRFRYNLQMSYKVLMVPGLLVVLVTLLGMFLSSMNIVREKEIGTIEQLNVTPIRKWQFILGKQLPFWFISLFLLALGLAVGKLAFDIPMEGSLVLLFAFAAVYTWVMLGLGFLLSTFADTQQQAMFLAWFILVIFILLSGLFSPIDNMPDWARTLTLFNPVRYFIEVVRMVLLKGSGLAAIAGQFLVTATFAVGINALAVINYRKRA